MEKKKKKKLFFQGGSIISSQKNPPLRRLPPLAPWRALNSSWIPDPGGGTAGLQGVWARCAPRHDPPRSPFPWWRNGAGRAPFTACSCGHTGLSAAATALPSPHLTLLLAGSCRSHSGGPELLRQLFSSARPLGGEAPRNGGASSSSEPVPSAPRRPPQLPAALTVPPPPPRPVPPLPSSRSPAPARPAPPGRPQSPPPPAGHVGPGLLGTRRGPSAAIASGRRQRGAGAGPASCGGPGGCQCPAGAAESRAALSNTRVF